MLCSHCGCDHEGKYCPVCGCPNQLPPPPMAPKEPEGKDPKRKRLWILLAIVGVVLAVSVGLLIWALSGRDSGEEPDAPEVDTGVHGACSDGDAHSFQTETVEAGCTQRGWTAYTCETCGYTYLTDVTPATGHLWKDGETLEAVTCTQDGEQVQTCALCHSEQTLSIPHSGHTYALTEAASDEELGKEVYACTVCAQRLVLAQDALLQPEPEEYIYLPDREADFSFLVRCEEDETYLREHLELNADYKILEEEENVYRIAPAQSYTQYENYIARPSGDVEFVEYNALTLKFSIIGPERAQIDFREEQILFLKTLLAQQGTDTYELEWDAGARRYYLTMDAGADPSMVGKILAVGDYESTEQILTGGDGALCFGKVERILHNEEGLTLLEMTVPKVSEVYEELDLYFTGLTGALSDVDNEAVEESFTEALTASDGFAEYVTAVHLAAGDYAAERGLVVTPLADAGKDNLKFELTEKSLKPLEDSACQLDLKGKVTYTIPVNDSSGRKAGSVELTCTAGVTSTICVGGSYQDEEATELYLINDTTSSLEFGVHCDVTYIADFQDTYLVNRNTKTIHTATCRIANSQTEAVNLEELTLDQIAQRYNGDKALMKADECKICLAVTGLDGSAYVLNNSTGILHCMNCTHVTSIKDCNLLTIYPDNTLKYETCKDCRPQDRQGKDFNNRMHNAMKGSNWADQLEQVKKQFEGTVKKPQPENAMLSLPFNVAGVFDIVLELTPEFEFDMEASVDFEITANAINIYGIRSVEDGFETYHYEKTGDVTAKLELIGEADMKLGLALSVKANPTGFGDAVYIRIRGHVGLYGHISGICQISGTLGKDVDSLCAARLETGLYLKLDGDWKILWFDDTFTILPEKRVPLCKWGYDRAYFAFEKEYMELEVAVDQDDTDIACNFSSLMKAKYLDLATLKEGTGIIASFGHDRYDIQVELKNEDGTPCQHLEYVAQKGILRKKQGAPEVFTVYLHINVSPKVKIASFADFMASRSTRMTYGYFLDPLVLKLEITTQKKTDPISLDELKPLAHEANTDNGCGSALLDLDGTGLSRGDDGKTFNVNGNIGADGTLYTDGFELWMGRLEFEEDTTWARATFPLDGKYKTLTGATGLIKGTVFSTKVSFFNGEELLAEYTLTEETCEQEIKVDVTGVKQLTVAASDTMGTSGGTSIALYNMFLEEAEKPSVYKEVLDLYYECISCKWSNWEKDYPDLPFEPADLCYMLPRYFSEDGLKDVGYALIDLNDDGQQELIISRVEDAQVGTIYDLFTLKDGKVVQVFSAGERDRYNLAVDNTILNDGSSSAATSLRSNDRLDAATGSLKTICCVLYDGYLDEENPYFLATDEHWTEPYDDPYKGLTPISEEEAMKIEESFPEPAVIPLIPFSQYKP